MASLTVAYIFWLLGGIVGLHHLYLGRMHHAVVWYSTLGGVLGMGWVRDLWRLPDYVQSSNAGKDYVERQEHRIALNPKPSCGKPRIFGLLVMGYLLTSVLVGLLPDYYDDARFGHSFERTCLIVVLAVVGSSIGVYIVANVGELQCTWKYPVVGALLSIPWQYTHPSTLIAGPLISTLVTWWWGLRWKPTEPLKRNRKAKCGKFIVFVVIWTALVACALYQNGTIGVDGGTKISLKVALANFFASPAWHQTKQSFYQFFQSSMEWGWDLVVHTVPFVSDIFHFVRSLNDDNIVRLCRKLSAQNHPDRFQSRYEKQRAHTRFIEIQNACNTLGKYT